MTNERRMSPRVELVVELYGKTIPMGLPVTLLNLSASGMGIRMTLPLPEATYQRFDLELADGTIVNLSGQIMHCEPAGESQFLIGVRFAHPVPDVLARIAGPANP
jgi:hypothetical protein